MFLGILVGTLCLIGLVRTVAGRRFRGGPWHYGAYGGGCGGYGGYRGYGGGPWRAGRGGFLWSILSRLDATPTQERAIIDALDELKATASELRGTVRETRGDLARTVRGTALDESALRAAEARVDDATLKMRSAVSASLGKVHGVLDDRQRKVLGDMIDAGWARC